MYYSDSDSNGRHELRVGKIVNEYLDRRAQGKAESEEELIAHYPDLAADIRLQLLVLREIQPAYSTIDSLVSQGILRKASDSQYVAELGAYKITDVLGRGGMGIVLKAYEESLNRTVALKILRPELAHDKIALQRFEREAKAAGGLRHQNIVSVYAVGQECGVHFLAMEYIEGSTLSEVLGEHGPLATEETRKVFRQILSGLQAAHDAGLIHRDIKSSNILLEGPDHQVKIADFGLARMAAPQTRLTIGDSALGTPEYMSPEQARGEANLDHRSDLYSAGVVLYEMLTGKTPFNASTPPVVIHQILHLDPPDPQSVNASADPQLTSITAQSCCRYTFSFSPK